MTEQSRKKYIKKINPKMFLNPTLLFVQTMYQKTTLPLHASPSEASSYRQRNLTLTEIQSDSVSKLAEKYFGGKKVKWDPKVVETIMNEELVASNFASHKLVLLELSHYLEKVIFAVALFDNNCVISIAYTLSLFFT